MNTVDEVRAIPAHRRNGLLLIPAVAFIGSQAYVAVSRTGDGTMVAAVLATTAVVVGGGLLLFMRSLAQKANKQLGKETKNHPDAIVFPAIGSPNLNGWLSKRDSVFPVSGFPVVVVDDVGIRFPSSSGTRNIRLGWNEISSVKMGSVRRGLSSHRAIHLTARDGTVELAPCGRLEVIGFRPAEEVLIADIFDFVRGHASILKHEL